MDLDKLTVHIGENWEPGGALCEKNFPPAQPYELRDAKPLRE
jgi:hypothetical protein